MPRRKNLETPEGRFWRKLKAEHCIIPGMMVKVERMPQGSMKYHKVIYVHAHSLDVGLLYECLKERWGIGTYVLRLVDEARQPLDEYGSLWAHLGNHDHLEDRLAQAQKEIEMDILEPVLEGDRKSRATTADTMNASAGMMTRRRAASSKLDLQMLDALKRSMESKGTDRAMSEVIRLVAEMRNEEYRQRMKKREEALGQLQQFLGSTQAEVQVTPQSQVPEDQAPIVPVSSEYQYLHSLPPTLGQALQRLKTHGMPGSMDKSQDEGKGDDQRRQARNSRKADQKLNK